MQIYDEILFKYFLADQYYQLRVMETEEKRMDLLYSGYAHATYTELGIGVQGAGIEELAIQIVENEEILARVKEKANRLKSVLADAVQHISIRDRLLLFTYFQTGVILTDRKDLAKAQEQLLDVLERHKQKVDSKLKKEYMSALPSVMNTNQHKRPYST